MTLTRPQKEAVARLGAAIQCQWPCGCVQVSAGASEFVVLPHGQVQPLDGRANKDTDNAVQHYTRPAAR